MCLGPPSSPADARRRIVAAADAGGTTGASVPAAGAGSAAPDDGGAGGPAPLRLRTVLEGIGPHAAVILTEEQVTAIAGGPKTPPVRVTVNGHTFPGRVGRMKGRILLGFNKAVREQVGVAAGDEIDVEIVHDAAPREVEVPDDLAAALADAGLRERFDALAASHRKEFARWVGEAKRAETREKRLAETVALVGEGRTRR